LKFRTENFSKYPCFAPKKQGLEIVNPQAAEKRVDEANAKYFSPAFSFIKVAKTPLPQ